MLESITWQQYLIAAGFVAAAYYGVVLYRFYGKPLVLNKKVPQMLPLEEQLDNEPDRMIAEAAIEELESLVNNIRNDIFEKAGKNADKAALMEAIRALVASYGGLHLPAYRNALNNFIIRDGNELCNADFSEEELEAEWRSLHS
jgi:hypothetical protein